jgi:hypothetical protein
MFLAGNDVLCQRHSKKFAMTRAPSLTHESRVLLRLRKASTERGATTLRLRVDLGATFHKLFRFLLQAGFDRFCTR